MPEISNSFAEEIKSFFEEKTTDVVVVISGDQEFKCHKAIPWITTVLLLGGRPPLAHFVLLVLP